MDNDRNTNAAPADESTPAASPPSDASTAEVKVETWNAADTGEEVAALAGRFMRFETDDLLAVACSDDTGALDQLCRDIRKMAASLLRQNER